MEIANITQNPLVAVQQFGPSKPELSRTDWKTHALVVLSYSLIAIGVALACASFYMAVTVHPMLAMASPFPTALGILGLRSQGTSSEKEATLKPRPIEKPLGLQNGGNDCWINSACQLFFNIPSYQKAIDRCLQAFEEGESRPEFTTEKYLALKELKALMDLYRFEKNRSSVRSISLVNTRLVREWAIRFVPDINSRVSQEDPMVLFEFLLDLIDHSLPVLEERQTSNNPNVLSQGRVERKGDTHPAEFFLELDLERYKEIDHVSFERVLRRFFHTTSVIDQGPYELTKTCKFDAPPDDLTIKIHRETYSTTEVDGKKEFRHSLISTKVDLPFMFEGKAKYFGEDVSYKLSAIVEHRGTTPRGGHYVCYMEDEKGNWWCCNDSRVTPISKEAVQKVKPYIVHYEKVIEEAEA